MNNSWIVGLLCRRNYALVTNINTKGTTDSLFFQYNESLDGLGEDMFILSLNNNDKIRLITAPEYVTSLVGEVISRYLSTFLFSIKKFS